MLKRLLPIGIALFALIQPVVAYAKNVVVSTSTANDLGPGPASLSQLQELIQRIINFIVPMAFIVLTIVLIMAGIKFLTSGGEPKKIASAGQTITWALLGMLFLIISWLILMLIHAVTGVNVTQFCIGFPGAPTNCK